MGNREPLRHADQKEGQDSISETRFVGQAERETKEEVEGGQRESWRTAVWDAAGHLCTPGPGDGGGPLPSRPGWSAAPHTAPPAPCCIPGAPFLQRRRQPGRCSLILSCLCSWTRWKSGNRTHAVRSPPFLRVNPRKLNIRVHASSLTVPTGVISHHYVYMLFTYTRNMPICCSSLP